MKFIDWFAGIGGFRLGLERAGHQCVWSCEIDSFARSVYAKRFGHEPEEGDINDVREVPDADLWCGGFPCQDLSVAGKRAGIHGKRSGLVWRFLELARVKKPRWLLLENVPGLLTANGGQALQALVRAIRECGYVVGAWRVLDARFFGVPQRRRRVFVLARRAGDGADPGEVLLEPEGVRGRAPARRATRAQAAAGASGRAGVCGPLDTRQTTRGAATLTSGGHPGSNAPGRTGRNTAGVSQRDGDGDLIAAPIAFDMAQITHPENRARCRPGDPAPTLLATFSNRPHVAYNVHASNRGEGGAQAHEDVVARALDTSGGFAAGQGGTLVGEAGGPAPSCGEGARAVNATQAVAYSFVPEGGQGADLRASETDVSQALTPTSEGRKTDRGVRILQGMAVRRLTPLECERLQGFPDDWTALPGAKDGPRYRVLGNAVAVPVIEWIGKRLGESVNIATKPLVFSASQFEKYARAPRAWWARYVLRLPERQTPAQVFGTTLHSVMERRMSGQEPFPSGWDAPISRADADIICRLTEAATRDKIVRRGCGTRLGFSTDVEAEFLLPLLDAENGKPEVLVKGYIDVPHEDGVDDHKSTRSLRWAKTPEEIARSIQMTIYAHAWLEARRALGLWDPPTGVWLRQIYFVKDPAAPVIEVRRTEVSSQVIAAAWEERKRQAREMRDLALRLPAGETTSARWNDVPCAGDKDQALAGVGACGDYGGCSYQLICGGVETFAQYRKRTTAVPEGPRGEEGMGIFSKRIAASGVTEAPPVVPVAPMSPPVNGGPTPPFLGAPAVAVSAATPAIGPRVREIARGAPPWTRADCSACVRPEGTEHAGKVCGIATSGSSCRICGSRQRAEGKINPDWYEYVWANGEAIWTAKAEFAAQIPESIREGSFRMSSATTVTTPPPAPPLLAVLPAFDGAPLATPAPTLLAASAPTPLATPAPTLLAAPAPAASRERKKKGFTLCVNCVPVGAKAIRLEEVHAKYALLLAQEKGAESFWSLNAFERRDALASIAEKIVEEEGFGTSTVIAESTSPDLKAFMDVMRSLAGTVIVGFGQ